MTMTTTKACSVCGTDLNGQKRIKDQQGRYYCHPCWGSGAKASATPQQSRPETSAAKAVASTATVGNTMPQPPDKDYPTSPPPPENARQSSGKMIPTFAVKMLWQNRWARWGTIVTVVLIVVLAVPAVKAYRQTQDDKAAMDANAKNGADMFQKMAESDERQAEASRKEAARLRGQANDLRGADDSGAVPEGPKSKHEAIHDDPAIIAYLDSRPELESLIKTGGTQLDAHLELLVSQDVLTGSDVQYIRRFSRKISTLPY